MCKHLNFTSLGVELGCHLDVVNGYVLQKVYLILLLLLCEGLEVKHLSELHSLLQFFEGDLRKTFLNLQFWTQQIERLPCFMSQLVEKPVDFTVKPDNRFVEKYLGLFHTSDLLNDRRLADHKIQYAVEDELLVDREQGLGIMFHNYLPTASMDKMDGESIHDVCNYMSHMSSFEHMCHREQQRHHSEEWSLYDQTTSYIYASGQVLNHTMFAQRNKSSIQQGEHTAADQSSGIHPVLSTGPHRVKLTNPLYRSYVEKSDRELRSLVRKTLSAPMCLHYTTHADVLDTILSICSCEEDKRGRRVSRRYYHHFQDVFSTEELCRLGVASKDRRQLL